MEFGKVINYTITINPTANKGFFVTVGCGQFAFSNVGDLLNALTDYLRNTEAWEKEYSRLECVLGRTDETPPERTE